MRTVITCTCGAKIELPGSREDQASRCPRCKAVPIAASLPGPIVTSVVALPHGQGATCPICQTAIGPSEGVLVCPACDQVHHRECWDDVGGCATYGCEKRRHRQVLAIACGVWVLAFALQVLPAGRVSFRGLPMIPLPQACFSRSWLGLRCPGCGLTRSIIHLAQGNWRASWQEHRLGVLMAIVITLQIPYRLLALRRPDRPLVAPRWQAVLGYALIALLLGNWLVELAAGRVTEL
jgi:Protein of unknown function (DUF2752)/Prokaryotic RING finger family 1